MNLNLLFSDNEKIETLEKLGYTVLEESTIVTHHEYHDRVVEESINVMNVYKNGENLPYNFQNVTDRKMSQVNEIFFDHLKNILLRRMNIFAETNIF